MNKEEAFEEYRKQTELLTTERTPGDAATMQAAAIVDELSQMVASLKNKNGTFRKDAVVERALTDASMLVRALTAPTQVAWCEPSGETERDPVSGNPRPKMAWRRAGTPLSPVLYDIKQNFVACARVMTAYARHIASPAYGEWRAIYVALEDYAAKHGMLQSLEEDFARAIVSRFSEALFALWADNEIEREVRHV